MAVVDAFHAALQRGDSKAALGVLAEDALIFESAGAERSKAEYASHHLGADMAFSKVVPSSVTKRQASALGNIAWVASEGRTTGNNRDDGPVPHRGRLEDRPRPLVVGTARRIGTSA